MSSLRASQVAAQIKMPLIHIYFKLNLNIILQALWKRLETHENFQGLEEGDIKTISDYTERLEARQTLITHKVGVKYSVSRMKGVTKRFIYDSQS